MTDPLEKGGMSRAEGPRIESKPRVSVVLISDGTLDELEGTIGWLHRHCHDISAELVAVVATTDEEIALLEENWPSVRFSGVSRGSSLPEMRQNGLRVATGDVVAMRMVSAGLDARWRDDLRRLARLPIEGKPLTSEADLVDERPAERVSRRRHKEVGARRERRLEAADSATEPPVQPHL
jgi:hypothetical protein